MKNLKGFLLAAVVLTASVGAAFATSGDKKQALFVETGYYFDNSAPTIKCIATSVQCTDLSGPVCTWTDANDVTHNLRRFSSDAMCGITLRRVN